MTDQLAQWQGDFGRDYTDRNIVNPASRTAWFRRTLKPLHLKSLLEVGCNRGHNLDAISTILPNAHVDGSEPNLYARRQAMRRGRVVFGSPVYTLPPFQYDLVLCCGILTHIPPARLDEAIRETHRVARRYLLAIEYHADTDEEVEYRGQPAMMWKRDYGNHYLRLFPDLAVRETGDVDDHDGFDDARYWLIEKP